jgi:hypothetical protein
VKLYSEYQKYNVFREPDWRFVRVLSLCDRHESPGRCTRRDDIYIKQMRNFLLRWRNRDNNDEREELLWENPGLYYAWKIYENREIQPATYNIIEARLLARQTPEEIAATFGTIKETIEWYEALFFNVSDKLDHRDWVTTQVLLPAVLRRHGQMPIESDIGGVAPNLIAYANKDYSICHPFLDSSMKLFAYFGGKYLVDSLITGFESGKPLNSQEDLAAWYDHHFSMAMRRRSLQAIQQFQCNRYNVMELFSTHTEIMKIEKSEDTASRDKTMIERHSKAMIDDIPWVVGADGETMLAGTKLGLYDAQAAELRDDELHAVATGHEPEALAASLPLSLPPPRKRAK